jgi:hypothetical protein
LAISGVLYIEKIGALFTIWNKRERIGKIKKSQVIFTAALIEILLLFCYNMDKIFCLEFKMHN